MKTYQQSMKNIEQIKPPEFPHGLVSNCMFLIASSTNSRKHVNHKISTPSITKRGAS